MKKLFAFLLAFLLLLSGCASKKGTNVKPDQIISAYEDAGYTVVCDYYDEKPEHGQIGYIRADHPDVDYIYFYIFETEDDAEAYKKEIYHPGVTGFFSIIFGDPSLVRCEVYGTVVVEYDQPDIFEPFEALLKNI